MRKYCAAYLLHLQLYRRTLAYPYQADTLYVTVVLGIAVYTGYRVANTINNAHNAQLGHC